MNPAAKAQEDMVQFKLPYQSNRNGAETLQQFPLISSNAEDAPKILKSWRGMSKTQLDSVVRECFERGFPIEPNEPIHMKVVNHVEPQYFVAEAILYDSGIPMQGMGENVREAIRNLYYRKTAYQGWGFEIDGI